MSYFDIEKNLEIALSDGRAIHIVSFKVDSDIEKELDAVLSGILARYNRDVLKASLFSCIIELATNATKANMKHLHFMEEGLNIEDSQQYAAGMSTFREKIHSRDWLDAYGQKAREKGLMVRMVFTHTPDGLCIEILNNMPLLPQDEARIRRKFNEAMRYDSLPEYYMDHADAMEGEGLGFALNLLLLKGENLNANLFRIGGEEQGTVARIEVPFTAEYRSRRPEKANHPEQLRRKAEDSPS
ncbi:MAG: hypothetical protein K1X75_09980 [Leptospirales bacterium]|nr:hypothetical protein [Leptospirales bacterium]